MNVRPLKATALVAGGAGFVGSHLCDALLERGMRVICLDNFQTGRRENIQPLLNNRSFSLVEADVARDALPDERVDCVFNLACPASPPHYQADPVRTMMTSVVGTLRLLEMAEQHGARFVQASTSEVYGDPEEHPQRESYWGHVNPIGPRACYDEGKRAAETLCFDLVRAGRVDVRVARIFNTYGPRMRPDDGRIISNFLVQALQGREITVYGTGRQTRSFCYVTDLVRGLIALMDVEEAPPGPVNLGNPGEFTVLELAQLIHRMVPGPSEIGFRPLPSDDPQRRQPDISRAAALLGWAPEVPLREGLRRTADWFTLNLGPAARPATAMARPAE
ncbi:UDP-glucuronic acid decarboxylase family protein [Pseudoroseicyclus tamaricis]|uniref:SDR family oxidoreductase n=1 Tax=Pseudoroseicyclus tamaricis TaxID=2705421 RepID=A0A6B2JP11_9RHOB|nr:UDP-glucuronic acid decarboxylase family protein [Pseudoroseicyclus tamaricis]NDU99787.1 SDR family oxidoreductase [Pseudoroseicyclus tamaricis]